MLLRTFDHRGVKIRLHVHDFEESKHPRAKSGKMAGEFVKKGTGGTAEAPEVEQEAAQEQPAEAAPSPVKAKKPPPPPKTGAEQTFISPNTGNLNFTGAQHELAGKRQGIFNQVSNAIDVRLGLHAKGKNVIGAWADGAENSLMVTYSKNADPAMVKAAAAIKAYIAEQKAALIFQPNKNGDHFMASFEIKGDLADIHDQLLTQGLKFHTLEATEDGARVHIFISGTEDEKRETGDAVHAAAKEAGSTVKFVAGNGEFIGTSLETGTDEEQREDARRAYKEIIDQMASTSGVGGRNVGDVWADADHHWRSATGADEGVGLVGSQGHAALISSRRPWAAGSLESDRYRRVDLASMKQEPEKFQQNMDLLKNTAGYPNFRKGELDGKTPEEISRIAVDHAKANLKFLYDNVDPEVREQGPLWYEGAHRMAQDAAKEYDVPVQSMAGVYAALSPQKNWDENVYLAKALVNIVKTKQNEAWDDKMTEIAKDIWTPDDPEKPTRQDKIIAAALENISGKTLGELTDLTEKAIWVRTYDEAHSDRQFQNLSPDGTPLGLAKKANGQPARAAWQSCSAISGAIQALESGGDRNVISDAMGEKHKVRCFYNNILDPHSKNNDVTMDTHAVGAALMRPLSASSQAVMHNLATGPKGEKQLAEARASGFKAGAESAASGMTGTYGLWADAYREAAAELEIEPRVLQSVVWEAKRRLYPDKMGKPQRRAVEQAWNDYHEGKSTLEEAQKKALKIGQDYAAAAKEKSGGKSKKRPDSSVDAEERAGDDAGELYQDQLGQYAARSVDSRIGGSIARRASGLVEGASRSGRAVDAVEFDFPIPLDPDLRALARNKPYNIIQDIFRIQAERERSRSARPLFADAFEEGKHPRGEGGQFTGIGSENPTYKKHIEEGHKLVTKHGFKSVRGPEDADMHLTPENKNSPDAAGPFTIYTKERGDTRHILRFYTKHAWEEDPEPLWNAFKESKNNPGVEGEGHYHEGLKEYLEKYHPTTKDRIMRVFKLRDAKVHVHLHDFEEAKHPRGQPGNKGQFGPGGSGSSSGSTVSPKSGTESKHPGHGYSAKARLVNGVIQTDNVNDAVRALYENKKVALEQPRQVSTLVSKLGDVAKRMERLGGKVPNFDLCNVSVEGTNLFCAMGKGIPRIKMPQLPDEKGEEFQQYLKSKGHKTSVGQEAASYLRATQSELVGVKVSGIMKFFRNKKPETDPPLFISKDGYIVDGHHRWAARVGLDAESGMFGNVKLNVVKVDLPILDLLQEAETFTGGKGHKGATAHDRIMRLFKIRDRKVFFHFHDFDPNEPRAESGQWTKGGGGGGRERKRETGFEPLTGGGKPGFTLPGGGKLPKHLASLRIPPAWTDVRYNPDPKGDLLVTGTDSKGRRQPLYSAKHSTSASANTFRRVQKLEPKWDTIMAKNARCMKVRDPRTRDLAGVLALIMHTAMRPGGEADTGADYKSYGATTLEGQHVITENGHTVLRFVSGKHHGKPIDMKITDSEIARDLQARAKAAGEGKQIFPNADAGRLLRHTKSLAGKDFKTKDFRTLIGTKTAANEIKDMPVPKSLAEYKKFAQAVAKKVAAVLGNTPAVALKSYISPHVFADWKLASGA